MLNNITATTKRMTFVASMLWISAFVPTQSNALTFVLPHNGNVVGNIQYATATAEDSLATIAMRYDMGGYEMMEANAGVDYVNPRPGTKIIVPSRFVLPEGPRNGIVINLAEMRLYYYHPDGIHVSTFPVGVGQEGWNTPLGKTQVVKKRENPTWVVPDSIMANHLAHGKVIPKVKPPGPDNPLGNYAMNLGFPSIVIHGTPYPKAVGVRSSHGCIRMTNADVEQLFKQVKVGTPVTIIHQPTKVGRLDNQLFLETHVPISSELNTQGGEYDVGQLIHKLVAKAGKYTVEWQAVEKAKHRPNGIPLPIGSLF